MSRLLFFALIAAVVYWLFQSYRKQPHGDVEGEAEDMVRCAHCGVHLPKRESIRDEAGYFCSEEHRREHADRPQ